MVSSLSRMEKGSMINPTLEDINQRVVYVYQNGKSEEGRITSFNDKYVFVRYEAERNSKATLRKDLKWW